MIDCPSSAFKRLISAPTSTHAENDQNSQLITTSLQTRHRNGAYNVTGSVDDSCSHSRSDLPLASPASAAAAVDLFYTHICVKATRSPPPPSLSDTGSGYAFNFHAHSIVRTAVQSTVIVRHCHWPTLLSSSTTDTPALTSGKRRPRNIYNRVQLSWTDEIHYSR